VVVVVVEVEVVEVDEDPADPGVVGLVDDVEVVVVSAPFPRRSSTVVDVATGVVVLVTAG
jgi:hypothetical protein